MGAISQRPAAVISLTCYVHLIEIHDHSIEVLKIMLKCCDGSRILYVVLITIEKLMLDVFITSRVRRKIIVVYAKYPDFKTHVRGLAKLIKEDAGNIQRELKRLEKIGFLISERQGNTKIYSTNKHFAIFKELQSIVLKSQRITQKNKQINT